MEKKRRLRNGEFTLSLSEDGGGGGDGSGDGTKVGPFPPLLPWCVAERTRLRPRGLGAGGLEVAPSTLATGHGLLCMLLFDISY